MSINLVLNVNKPSGITSHKVVEEIRKIFSIKKVGHAGTLDPQAEGVLVILIGDATKKAIHFLEMDKEYIGEATFGIATDTLDRDGKVVKMQEGIHLDEDKIKNVIYEFKGKIKQKPPMYSAVKYKGKKLYELARKGKNADVKEREVEIYDIRILSILQDKFPKVRFTVSCSKGTYIRKLVEDIGEKMNLPVHLSSLTRTRVGPYRIEDAIPLEKLKKCKQMKSS